MLIMIPITFFLNAWKHDLLTAFTFAVAIAIGITPLLLPVILSSSLAKGAIAMSKKKTIVKKLDSIQNFGGMNILCTDKTGTLTKDEIVLEKYLDVNGAEDYSILQETFLNAYFQTGLKGSIDNAILKKAEEKQISYIYKNYNKIDEIPFDFSSRRLSVIVANKESKSNILITKGAVEEILNISSFVKYKDKVFPITTDIKNNVKNISKKLNEDGLRVIAVCEKLDLAKSSDFSISDEAKMTLVRFYRFFRPTKRICKTSCCKIK